MVRKLNCYVLIGIISFAINAYTVPPPSEYTMEMFVEDLRSAHLVALGEVTDIDTLTSGSDIEQIQYTDFKVMKCYKGGIESKDSMVYIKNQLNLVGGYSQNYEIGLRSIICFYDSYKDGKHLRANARGKFDIAKGDSVIPPPVGLGFSSDFDYNLTLESFESLIEQTIQSEEMIQLIPVLPKEGQNIRFKTSINLSGGATLNDVVLEMGKSSNIINYTLSFTPCTSEVCPAIFLIVDTTVALGELKAGEYTAYRYEINYLINEPQGLFAPDDSVSFTVYKAAVDIKPKFFAVNNNNRLQCSPNPFCNTTFFSIPGYISESRSTQMGIYELSGREVRRIVDYRALINGFKWDGRDNHGNNLPAGLYIIRFMNEDKILTTNIYKTE